MLICSLCATIFCQSEHRSNHDARFCKSNSTERVAYARDVRRIIQALWRGRALRRSYLVYREMRSLYQQQTLLMPSHG